MRMHINIDAKLVAQLDKRVGKRKRSAYITELLRRALEDQRRWDDIFAALGKIEDKGHDWDADPAAWVRQQRRSDPRRVG
jgi:Arc/MetJ family transcription regulator